MSSSLRFSEFCFTENISRNTHWSGFSLLDFLLSFQCKAQCKSGCLLHFSICEQERKEFQSSSKAAKLAPVSQAGATLLSLFPAAFRQSPAGFRAAWGSPHSTGVSSLAWPQCRVQRPKGAQSWVCSGCPSRPRAVPADVSCARASLLSLGPSRAVLAVAQGLPLPSVPRGRGTPQRLP